MLQNITLTGALSAIREYVERSKGHNIDWEKVKVLEREPRDFPRKILEAIYIRTLNPKLNRDKGLELDPVIWDKAFSHQGDQGAKWKFFPDVTKHR